MKYIKYKEFINGLKQEIDLNSTVDPEINPMLYGFVRGLKSALAYANALITDIGITDKTIVINNKDGCSWCDGVGTSPKGYFCGECDDVEKDTCCVREKENKE